MQQFGLMGMLEAVEALGHVADEHHGYLCQKQLGYA